MKERELRARARKGLYSTTSPYKTSTGKKFSNSESVQHTLNDLNKTKIDESMSNITNVECNSPTDSPIMSFDETQFNFGKIETNLNHNMSADEGCAMSTRTEVNEQTTDTCSGLMSDTYNADYHTGQFGQSDSLKSSCIGFYSAISHQTRKEFSKTYPQPKGKSNKLETHGRRSMAWSENNLSKDTDIDLDVFIPIKLKTRLSETPPSSVPRMDEVDQNNISRKLFPRRDKKSTESVVYIQHGRATDSVDGDIFGADIYTDESDKKKEYFRHFFCKLDRDSPADKMKVQKGDELVMVNDTFAPGLNHKQIMELFSRIPVDGFTRFTMILRRKAHHSRTFTSKQWEWFETSAIFVPEFDKEPETKDLHYNPISNNMWDKTTPHRYKVIGQQDFLTLSKDGVGVDILHGNKVKDEYKSIWKHAIVRENASDATKLVFEASLSCADRKYFATIHCNNVTVVEKEVFFQYRTVGSQIYFKQGNSYLNCRNRTVGASTDEQFFEEFGSPGHRDVVDGCCTSACYTTGSTLESRRITRSMSRQPSYTTQFSHMSV